MGQFTIYLNNVNHNTPELIKMNSEMYLMQYQINSIANSLAIKSSKGTELKRRLKDAASEVSDEKRKVGDLASGLQRVTNRYECAEVESLRQYSNASIIWDKRNYDVRTGSGLTSILHTFDQSSAIPTVASVGGLTAGLGLKSSEGAKAAVKSFMSGSGKKEDSNNNEKKKSSKKKSKKKKGKWATVKGAVGGAYKKSKKAVKKGYNSAKKTVKKGADSLKKTAKKGWDATKKGYKEAKKAAKNVYKKAGEKYTSVKNSLKKIYNKPCVKYPVDAIVSFAKVPTTIVKTTGKLVKDVGTGNMPMFFADITSGTVDICDKVFNAGQDLSALAYYGESRFYKSILHDDEWAKIAMEDAVRENSKNGLAKEIGGLWSKGEDYVNALLDGNKIYKGITSVTGLAEDYSDFKENKDWVEFLTKIKKNESTDGWITIWSNNASNIDTAFSVGNDILTGHGWDTVLDIVNPADSFHDIHEGGDTLFSYLTGESMGENLTRIFKEFSAKSVGGSSAGGSVGGGAW